MSAKEIGEEEILLQWLPMREKIFEKFTRADTDEKRATLLQVFKAMMDIVEEHVAKTQPAALKGFREARQADYKTLVVMGMHKQHLTPVHALGEGFDGSAR